MDQEQSPEQIDEDQDRAKALEPETSDVDFNHVRGLMYALVTICVFCASILLGPDAQILPADGKLKIPIVDLNIKQGSFLYFGPIIIICVSVYTYLFLLKILARVKAGFENSDQYIFTMQNPAAQVATYGIFFWLPAIVLFAFAYKALPRPESANLLGVALVFLISILAIQLLLRLKKTFYLPVVATSILCVALILPGFVWERGWMEYVRMTVLSWRPMALEKAPLKARDLRNVEIRYAKAESITLEGSDLRNAVIKDADLTDANLMGADLRDARLECSMLKNANLEKADLEDAKLLVTNFKEAKFQRAKMRGVSFHDDAGLTCEDGLKRTSLEKANLEEAILKEANLSYVSLSGAFLNGADLSDAKIIKVDGPSTYFLEKTYFNTKLRREAKLERAVLLCSDLEGAKMIGANLTRAMLGGIDLSEADLSSANLKQANFDILSCHDSCIDKYISCSVEDLHDSNCECKDNRKMTESKLAGANLQFANLYQSSLVEADLSDTDSSSGAVKLRGADLRGANLRDATLSGANLEDADLLFAILLGAKGLHCDQLKSARNWQASIHDQDLECSQKVLNFEGLGRNLKQQELNELRSVFEKFASESRKRPTESEKKSGRVDTYRKLEGAIMSGINLRNIVLEGIFMNRAKLQGANLSGAKLKGARFKDARMERAKLRGADLRNAFLWETNFENADLRKADLEGAELNGAILLGADLKGANLNGVLGLTCDQLKAAKNYHRSYRENELACGGKLPDGSYPKKSVFKKQDLTSSN